LNCRNDVPPTATSKLAKVYPGAAAAAVEHVVSLATTFA
jgi:hypothetical protein